MSEESNKPKRLVLFFEYPDVLTTVAFQTIVEILNDGLKGTDLEGAKLILLEWR